MPVIDINDTKHVYDALLKHFQEFNDAEQRATKMIEQAEPKNINKLVNKTKNQIVARLKKEKGNMDLQAQQHEMTD